MKFSIITPTNSCEYLKELYASIHSQQKDWEWILLINGGALSSPIPEEILIDDRVRIYRDESGINKIGYLKNKAFNLAKGDILVEVDADDILTQDALSELEIAFNDPLIGFVYSNNAKLTDNFIPYNKYYGWEHSKVDFNNQNLFVMKSFGPSAAAMMFIWYAPDHIRAWRKTVYQEIGGHNPEMDVCDDHELLIRTYLKTKMKFIDKCLYLYRITGENTYLKRNQAIQETTKQLFRQYAQVLAERDAELNGLEKIDLGGGIFPREGYTVIDKKNAHIQWDLNDCIPCPDNSVGVVNASHIIEHLKDKQQIIYEIYRVLADGGWAFIDVPSTDGRGAFMDPTHVSYWNQNSFLYYTRKEQAQFIGNETIRFQEFNLETIYPDKWWEENHILVTRVWLRAIKSNARRPHWIGI